MLSESITGIKETVISTGWKNAEWVCAFWDSGQLPCLTEEIHHNQLFYVQHLQTLVHELTTG